jgi:hypothetical protein
MAGSTVVPFACAVPIDCPAPWGPPPFGPPNGVVVAVPSPPAAFPPQPFEATHTGAFAVAGAEAAAVGDTVVLLACTVPTDLLPDCGLLELADGLPLRDVAVAPPLVALPPQPFEATHTGAFAVTGAAAEADGATVVLLACTVPAD